MRMFKIAPLHKVIFVLGVGIIVPAVFLAYLVFRHTLAQPESELARLKALSRDVLDTTAGLIESGVETLFERVAKSVQGETRDEISDSLREIESQGIVQRAFLIEDGSSVIYPDISVTRPEDPDDTAVALPALLTNRLILRAAMVEAEGENLPFAVSLYRRALSGASSDALKAELLHRLSLLLARLGEFDQAAGHAMQAAELFKSSQGRSWKWVLATYNFGRWAADAGRRRLASFPLIGLYADIVRAKEPFGVGERTSLVREKVLSILEDLRAHPTSPDPAEKILEYVDALIEEEAEAERTRELAAGLDVFLPALSLGASQIPPGEIDVVHGIVEGRPVELVYWTPPNRESANLVAGFSVNLAALASVVGTRLIPKADTGREPLLSLVDAEGLLVTGLPPHGESPPLASVRMTGLVPGWELQARELNPGQIERAARRYLALNLALLGFVAAAISLSVWFTARSLAQEVELGRLKSGFVSSVSHELKTPLSLIRLYNDTLFMNRVADPDKKAKYHEVIGRECDRLSRLIDRVLDFSRAEIGRRKYDLRDEDLASLVESAIEICEPEAMVKDISIDADGLSRRVPVRADADALVQALENIIDNAIKYSPRQSRVQVVLNTDDNQASISVSDSGIGIDPTEHGRIFEEFYRAARPEVRTIRGSGLGLALVRHTVERHGGSVGVTSSVGKGSTFNVTLPLAKEAGSFDGQSKRDDSSRRRRARPRLRPQR